MCNCIELTNDALAEYNAGLDVPFRINFATGQQLTPRVTIATYKLDSHKQGHGRRSTILASFCPFCGEKYTDPTDHVREGTTNG